MNNDIVSIFDDFFDKTPYLIGYKDFFHEPTFLNTFKTSFPPYNIFKEGDKTYLEIACAGYSKERLDVNFDEASGMITIKGVSPKQEELKNITYTYRGIANREFSLSLPIHSNLELEECSYRNGMLLIEFKNKAKKETMKSIEIKD